MNQVSRDFIVTCVLGGKTLPATLRVGNTYKYTVQEVLELPVDRIRQIGKDLHTAIQNHGGSPFEPDSELKVEAILAKDWESFLLEVLNYKVDLQKKKENESTRRKLQEELDSMKTPAERKKELKEQLTALAD